MPRNIAPYAKPVATIHAEAKNIRETSKLFGVVKMVIMKAPVEPTATPTRYSRPVHT
jgi:hypothetical protein